MNSTNGDSEEIRRVIDLIAGAKLPDGIPNDFLTVPQQGVAYATGTMLPIIGAPSPMRPPPQGLRLPGADPAEYDFYGTYVTLPEYTPLGKNLDLQGIADSYRRESLIIALASLNMICDREELLTETTTEYLLALGPVVGDRLRQAMKAPTGGMGRRLIAPQPLLAAMRWLMGRPPLTEPVTDPTTPLHAVLFSHAVANQLVSGDGLEKTELSLEDTKLLMLVMMNLGSLGERPDVYASIDRTLRLWQDFGDRAVDELGAHACDVFRDVIGLDPADFLAVGFALLAHVMAWTPGQPMLLPRSIQPDAPVETIDRVLTFISRPLDECLLSLGDPQSEFDILAIESHPVLELREGLLVLDQHLLWKRCTSGLFWVLHDSLKATNEQSAERFRKAYAAMVEAAVEDMVHEMTPPALGGGRTFYTEEDLLAAYGEGKKRCDAVADFGSTLMLVEVVSGQLTVPTRIGADLVKLDKDFSRLVLQKCEQLDSTATLLIADEEPLTHVPHGVRYPAILPVLVVGGGFQLNSLSYSYIRARLAESNHLQHALVLPVCVLDPEDVEQLEALAENGASSAEVLTNWQASEYRDMPFGNFLYRQQLPIEQRRPTRMEATVGPAFDEIVSRIGLNRRPEQNPATDG